MTEQKKIILRVRSNGMEKDLSDVKVLAVIPWSENIVCCGLNVRMAYETENDTDKYLTDIVSKGEVVRIHLVSEAFNIPVDIHGGNVGECYFGNINPTVFERREDIDGKA